MKNIEARISEIEKQLTIELKDPGLVWDLMCDMEETMNNYDFQGNPLYTPEEWTEIFARLFVSRERYIEIKGQGKPYNFPEYNQAVIEEILKIQNERMSKMNPNSSIEKETIQTKNKEVIPCQ